MRKKLRLAAAAILVIVLIGFALSFAIDAMARRTATAIAADLVGMEFEVGSMHIGLLGLLRGRGWAEDLVLKNPQGVEGPQAFVAERARFRFDTWAYVARGEIRVTRSYCTGARISAIRSADGSINIQPVLEFFYGPEEDVVVEPSTAIVIEQGRMKDSVYSFIDRASGTQAIVTEIAIDSARAQGLTNIPARGDVTDGLPGVSTVRGAFIFDGERKGSLRLNTRFSTLAEPLSFTLTEARIDRADLARFSPYLSMLGPVAIRRGQLSVAGTGHCNKGKLDINLAVTIENALVELTGAAGALASAVGGKRLSTREIGIFETSVGIAGTLREPIPKGIEDPGTALRKGLSSGLTRAGAALDKIKDRDPDAPTSRAAGALKEGGQLLKGLFGGKDEKTPQEDD